MTRMNTAGHARVRSLPALTAGAFLTLVTAGHAGTITVAPGYTLTPLILPSVSNTGVDSLAVSGSNIFVGYSNGVPSDGSGGSAASTIAEYSTGGLLENTFSVVGGNDGLRVNPLTGQVWVLQNQDGNANLRIIDPAQGLLPTVYNYGNYANPSYSGFDDLVFSGNNAFLSATNPMAGTDPVLYETSAVLPASGPVNLTKILTADLNGKLSGNNILVDTDSLAITPNGSLLLNDQGSAPLGASQPLPTLTLVTNPAAANQGTSQIFPSNLAGNAVSTDDTRFAPAGTKTLLIAVGSSTSDTVYALTGSFAADTALTATKGSGFVGSLDMNTGKITPLVSGLTSPHGLAFVPAAAAVPEASSAVLFGFGLLALPLCARRRTTR